MKLELKIFLAALRERRELDAVLPDLLSAMNYDVISKPGVGVGQFGVDIAAVGTDDDGIRKLFLFVVKEGNLNRNNWQGDPTRVYESVNDVLNFYIGACVPAEHGHLPVMICICLGGEVEQTVGPRVAGFTKRNSNDKVSIAVWDGDRLAGLITRYLLREELLPRAEQNHFRKSLAMVDTSETSIRYFRSLVDGMFAKPVSQPKHYEKILSRLNVCLQVLFVWGRDAGNLDAPYLAAEYALLRSWDAASPWTGKKKAGTAAVIAAHKRLQRTARGVFGAYVEKLSPSFGHLFALSALVPSHEYVDINLKLFDVLGRVANYGSWLFQSVMDEGLSESEIEDISDQIITTRDALANIIANNPGLHSPFLDSQTIDVVLTCLFLHAQGGDDALRQWLPDMVSRYVFAYRMNNRYPIYNDNYRSLITHPRARTDEYRSKQTDASSLLPSIAGWLAILQENDALSEFAAFARSELQHCNFQFWLPQLSSETFLFTNKGNTGGRTLHSLPIAAEGPEPINLLQTELNTGDDFAQISAMRHEMPALIFTACRHFRIPVPPQFWSDLWEAPPKASM